MQSQRDRPLRRTVPGLKSQGGGGHDLGHGERGGQPEVPLRQQRQPGLHLHQHGLRRRQDFARGDVDRLQHGKQSHIPEVTDRMFDDAGGWADPNMKNRYRRRKQDNAQKVVELRQDARGKS